jgi:2-keto-4-pentenoate hydratase
VSGLIQNCAGDLALAEQERRAIAPLTEKYPSLTIDDAYAIQLANVARRRALGERVVGHKVGLTAAAMRELFGVHEPDYGHLLDTMVQPASRPLDLRELIDPQIEVEPAFVLGRSLAGPGVTREDVMKACDYVSVCFEVIDSRIADWRIRVQDTIADNGSSARVVLGETRLKPGDLDLGQLDTSLELDDEVVARGNTHAILEHPANAVAWLANALARFDIALRAGDVVLPGTCTLSRRIAGRRHALGRIAGLGTVTLSFEHEPTVKRRPS